MNVHDFVRRNGHTIHVPIYYSILSDGEVIVDYLLMKEYFETEINKLEVEI